MLGLSALIHQKISSFTKRATLGLAAASFVLATAAWGQSTEKVLIKSLVNGNGGLTFDPHGDLYGADQKLTQFGAIYRLHRFPNGAWGKTILYRFAGGSDGANPEPNVVFDGAGNLYGTTSSGGDNNNGTVFQLKPTPSGPWIKKTLYIFEVGPNGFVPSNVIIDDQGNLYGTTYLGPNGTIFELAHDSDGTFTYKVLYQFTGGVDGGNPATGLVRDSAGNLYGTTPDGGAKGHGTVFELSPEANGTWTFHLVYSFCSRAKCRDGDGSASSLTLDSHDNLYGVTSNGGQTSLCDYSPPDSWGCGVAFKLTHLRTSAWSFQLLYSFCSQFAINPNGVRVDCSDGAQPTGRLVLDQAGQLYGTTEGGGIARSGTAFRLSHVAGSPWTEDVLHSFCSTSNCADGSSPGSGGLALDSAGNLFGTTSKVVFEVTP